MAVQNRSTTQVGSGVDFTGAVANEELPGRRVDGSREGFISSFEISESFRYLVTNQTAYLIRVQHDDPEVGELVLPPFAQRVIKGARLRPFERLIRLHRQRHEIFVGR